MAYNCFISLMLFLFIVFLTQIAESQKVPAIFLFGDSLIDVGNNNHLELSVAKANFPHNGIDYPGEKPTGRFSNGKNSADLFAEKLGLPTSPPYLSVRFNSNITKVVLEGGGMSFASGGAKIFNETNELLKQAISMSQQIEYYTKVHGELLQQLGTVATQTYLSKSLFVIVIGSNDILGYFSSNFDLLDLFKLDFNLHQKYKTPQQYINALIVALGGQLKKIYGLGARKFAVSGTGLIGCCPSQRIQNKTGNGECNEETNFWSLKLNEAVKSLLQELKSEFNDINYSLFSSYNLMLDINQNPSQYGFSEIRSACCGRGNLNAQVPCLPIAELCDNRRDHLFWDLYHPTEATAKMFADTFFDGSEKYTYPINLGQLVAM